MARTSLAAVAEMLCRHGQKEDNAQLSTAYTPGTSFLATTKMCFVCAELDGTERLMVVWSNRTTPPRGLSLSADGALQTPEVHLAPDRAVT